MSNTTYRRSGVPARPKREVAPVEADVDQDADEYDEYIDDEQPTGLFSTPARTVTVIASLGMVLVLFASVIWILTSRGSTPAINPSTTTNKGGIQVSLITKANVGDQNVAPSKGSKAPDFEWTDATSGKPMRITSLNKPVFVNFWGTWCGPCKSEMPEMQKAFDKYRSQIEFVGVSMGKRDNVDGVRNFINTPQNGPTGALAYTWRFVQDDNYDVATRYQIQAVPSSFFIGTDGTIRAVQVGAMNASMIEAYLQQIK